jgi:flagellar motor switch/type III secretory pathway protein FliN
MADTVPQVATQALAEMTSSTALSARTAAQSADPLSGLSRVPAFLTVEVPVVGLTVRDLFRLEKGSIVATAQSTGANVPLRIGGRLLAWGELQVAGERLALRVAELA